jgi:cell division inhibitor SulA
VEQPVDSSAHANVNILQHLREIVRGDALEKNQLSPVSLTLFERLLPQQELSPGSLVEWLSSGPGSGAWLPCLETVRELQQQGYTLILIDPEGEFYPPAAGYWGLDLDRLIIVQPAHPKEVWWTLEQAFRCQAKIVVLSPLGELPQSTYRRLKLAAEAGRNFGFFLRQKNLQRFRSWADLRLLVESLPSPETSLSRRLKISLLSARGTGWRESHLVLDIDHESGAVSLVSQLDRAASEAGITRAS